MSDKQNKSVVIHLDILGRILFGWGVVATVLAVIWGMALLLGPTGLVILSFVVAVLAVSAVIYAGMVQNKEHPLRDNKYE